MQVIRDIINEHGIRSEGLTVSGSMAMRFAMTKDGYREGERLDEYEPMVESISLAPSHGRPFIIEPGTEMFQVIASTLDDLVRLPLYTMVQRQGDPAPDRRATFSYEFAMIDDLARAEDDWLKGLIENDEALLDDVAWRRFRYSEAFSDYDWDRETYLKLRQELRDSQYSASPVNDYCRWWARSAREHTASDGTLTTETRSTAERFLEIWRDRGADAETMKHSLTQSLKVHPQHSPLFDAFVDEHLGLATSFSP